MARGRRHSTGFGYIGFGNVQNVFNRNSRKPFSEVKEKLNYEAELHYELDFHHHSLTKEEREAIKNKIRTEEKAKNRKAIIISAILYPFVLYGVYRLIIAVMNN